MTKTTASARAPDAPGPAIRMSLRLSSDAASEEIAAVEVYLPDGMPPSVRTAVEEQCREIVRTVSGSLLVGWEG